MQSSLQSAMTYLIQADSFVNKIKPMHVVYLRNSIIKFYIVMEEIYNVMFGLLVISFLKLMKHLHDWRFSQ